MAPDIRLGRDYLRRLSELEQEVARRQVSAGASSLETGAQTGARQGTQALRQLRREALLANPLLNFQQLLVVRQSAKSPELGLPRNWQSNSSLPKTGFDDLIADERTGAARGPGHLGGGDGFLRLAAEEA